MKSFIVAVALVVFASTAFGADVKTATTVTKAPVQSSISSAKKAAPVKKSSKKKVKKGTKKPVQKQISSAKK